MRLAESVDFPGGSDTGKYRMDCMSLVARGHASLSAQINWEALWATSIPLLDRIRSRCSIRVVLGGGV